MINEKGEKKKFKSLNEFTHIEDKHGEPQSGSPQIKNGKIVGPDISLYRYVKV